MTIGPTEIFHLVRAGDEPTDPECQSAHSTWNAPCAAVVFQTSDGVHYLSAIEASRPEDRSGSPIHTDARRIEAWETFLVEDVAR